MSLLRVAELRPREGEAAAMLPSGARWLPSHVQVTVQRARALRPKGGPDDAFVALQLGRQRLRTAVATQRGGGPRWDEQCALELPPSSAPDELDGAALLLQLTVWQRALVGADRFLGRASVPLAALLEGGRSHLDQWYKLHSKPGKKAKERGEIQLSIQFTRHSLTASMFDLSVKDKPRSPFSRLKDKVKGRRKYDLESASAIVPSSSGGLDDGDCDLAGKKTKARGFFKSRLRKSSLTQSNTSLGSDSTLSSASSLVGISAAETLAPSPSRHSSLSSDHSAGDFLSSPKLTHKRAFSDEASQIRALPESKSVQSLRPQNEPISRSSLCINGSHIYCEEPSPKPASLSSATPPAPPQSVPSKPGESPVSTGPYAPEPELPPWSSSNFQKGPPKDPPRFIPSPPILAAQEEDKLSVKTIALNKHRGRGRREEGLYTDSRPVQIAMPMVFSSDVMRVRPRTEEGERAQAGVLHRGNSKDGDERRLVEEDLGGPPKDVVTAGGDKRDQSGRWGLPDSKESLPKPSSPPEWLSAPEVAKDACFSVDRGPAAFVRVGELQVEAAAHGASHCEVAAAAVKPLLDWDDSFDAFATSRLRPDVCRGAPQPPATIVDIVDPAGGQDGAGPCESKGEPRGNVSHQEGEDPSPSSGGLPSSAPERGLMGHLGEQLERWPEDTTLPWGTVLAYGACEDTSRTGGSAGAEESEGSQHLGEQLASEGEMAIARAWQGRWPFLSAGATSNALSDPEVALRQAVADAASRPAFSEVVFPKGEEEKTPKANAWEEPALVVPGEGLAAEAEAGSSSWADQFSWDLGRPEQAASLMSTCPGLQATFKEVADEAPLEPGCSTASGQEDAGKGDGRRPEFPPPKPPRSFTPLSLEEETNRAVWGMQGARWQEGMAERDPLEDSAGEACQQGSPLGQVSSSPALAVIIGAGGEGTGHVTEGFGVSAEADNPTLANELMSQAVSSGDSLLVANGGAGQSATCPPKLPVGGLGQVGALEQASHHKGGKPCGPDWGTLRPAEFPGQALMQTAQELLRPGEAGARPSQPLQESAASPSVLFWAALEEQQLRLPQDCPGWEQPDEPGLGKSSPVSRQAQGDGLGPDSSQMEAAGSVGNQTSPPGTPHTRLSAEGMFREGPEGHWTGESELSSSWSGDGVRDFERAGFWLSAGGGQSSMCDTGRMPGNPFASWSGPPAKNNPFAEERPGVLALACRGPLGSRALDPAALLPGPFPASHSEAQPLAPTPSLGAAPHREGFEFPSPIEQLASSGGSAQPSRSGMASAPSVLPVETQPAEEGLLQQMTSSPHLVRPISTPVAETAGEEEAAKQQQPSLTSGQSPVQPSQQQPEPSSVDSAAPVLQLANTEPKRDPAGLDPSAKYYHLTHEELIQLVLKREAELGKKQEHVQELENYIDQLLVRIMEQSPTLLQIPLGGEPKIAK